MVKDATAAPDGVNRRLGSSVRLPTTTIWVSLAIGAFLSDEVDGTDPGDGDAEYLDEAGGVGVKGDNRAAGAGGEVHGGSLNHMCVYSESSRWVGGSQSLNGSANIASPPMSIHSDTAHSTSPNGASASPNRNTAIARTSSRAPIGHASSTAINRVGPLMGSPPLAIVRIARGRWNPTPRARPGLEPGSLPAGLPPSAATVA